MGMDVKKYHSFTVRKLMMECIPHLTVVSLYLIIAEGSGLLSEVFPLLLVGLGILSLYFVGWKATLKKRSEKSLNVISSSVVYIFLRGCRHDDAQTNSVNSAGPRRDLAASWHETMDGGGARSAVPRLSANHLQSP
jgi:hypothetical protein